MLDYNQYLVCFFFFAFFFFFKSKFQNVEIFKILIHAISALSSKFNDIVKVKMIPFCLTLLLFCNSYFTLTFLVMLPKVIKTNFALFISMTTGQKIISAHLNFFYNAFLIFQEITFFLMKTLLNFSKMKFIKQLRENQQR